MDKEEQMAMLKSDSLVLHAEVCSPGTKLVWGEGNLDSKLMLIGEAPGGQEDRLGRPFVGLAGQLLNEELQRAGVARDSIYITNVVKCRPTRLSAGGEANRTPGAKEVKPWLETLLKELEIVSPSVLLCLGAVAASSVIHPNFTMNAQRGVWFDGPLGTSAMATFHPAYLLRRKAYSEQLELFRLDLDAAWKAASQSLGASEAKPPKSGT